MHHAVKPVDAFVSDYQVTSKQIQKNYSQKSIQNVKLEKLRSKCEQSGSLKHFATSLYNIWDVKSEGKIQVKDIV